MFSPDKDEDLINSLIHECKVKDSLIHELYSRLYKEDKISSEFEKNQVIKTMREQALIDGIKDQNGRLWFCDPEDDCIDPIDAESLTETGSHREPLCYWWEDMRPREVKRLIMDSYARGFREGCRQFSKKNK